MMMFPLSGRFVCMLVVGLLGVPLAGRAQTSSDLPPLPEDLMPVLRPILVTALGQSPQMIVQNINISTAEAVLIQDRAGMLPGVSGSAQYSANKATVAQQTSSPSSSSSSSGLFYSLSFSQPLFYWGALKARTDSGKIGIYIAEHQYADAYRLLVVSLRTQFLALVTKKIMLRNAEYALKQAEETLATVEERFKTGRASTEDVTVPRLAVDEARLARDQAVEDLENSKRLFLLMVGKADLDLEAVPDDVPRPVYAPEVVARLLQEFVQSDAEQTYSTRVWRDYIKSADLDYRIARVNLLPKFSFSANISQANVTSASVNSVSQVGVSSNGWSVVGSWSIFDGMATRGAKLSILHRKRSYERTLRTTTDQTIAQVRDLEKQLGFAWRSLEISQSRCDLSETTFKRLEENLKLGSASQTMVNSAQLNFYASQFTLAYTRSGYLNYWSQFVSTLCVDPILNVMPLSYLKDGK
jgi:outer membrane protein TolC